MRHYAPVRADGSYPKSLLLTGSELRPVLPNTTRPALRGFPAGRACIQGAIAVAQCAAPAPPHCLQEKPCGCGKAAAGHSFPFARSDHHWSVPQGTQWIPVRPARRSAWLPVRAGRCTGRWLFRAAPRAGYRQESVRDHRLQHGHHSGPQFR